jgi:hypothetical protein
MTEEVPVPALTTSAAVAPAAPRTVLSAVARHVATLNLPAVAGRVYAGSAPASVTLEESAPYVETSTVAGPTPAVRGDGSVLAWDHLVQVDAWEREEVEDPALATALLVGLEDRTLDHAGGADGWRVTLDAAERTDGFPDPGWARHRLTVRVRQGR